MTRVLVADAHAVVRSGLWQILPFAPDMKVQAKAKTSWETVECARAGGLDIVLLNLNMPGCSRLDLVRRAKVEAP